MTQTSNFPLGRLEPTDWKHIEKYPLQLEATVLTVEKIFRLRYHRESYNQGREGACVGYGSSWAMSILNGKYYDAHRLYKEAQKIDEWPGENYEGTSVRAAMDVLRQQGHWRVLNGVTREVSPDHGILENRWAGNVDEIRTCVARQVPVVLGVNWYLNFDNPQFDGNKGEFWIGRGDLGRIRGGHAVCIYGASDKRQAVRIVNNWGMKYPFVWMPYDVLQRLLNENGEATIITDRPGPEKG